LLTDIGDSAAHVGCQDTGTDLPLSFSSTRS
jgi:hypothetical protein